MIKILNISTQMRVSGVQCFAYVKFLLGPSFTGYHGVSSHCVQHETLLILQDTKLVIQPDGAVKLYSLAKATSKAFDRVIRVVRTATGQNLQKPHWGTEPLLTLKMAGVRWLE